MKHKKLLIALMTVFTVLVALFIFIMLWFWADRYPDFSDFNAEAEIPDLKKGATPQGLASYKFYVPDENGEFTDTTKKQDYFFVSAYFKKQASRIYVIGRETGYIGYVTLKGLDGTSDFTGHCGGVAINDQTLWVASGSSEAGKGNVYVYKEDGYTNVVSSIISKARENGEIAFKNKFAANCNASFLYYYRANPDGNSASYQDRLYLGEFYRSGNYETDKNHYITTPAGNKNKAFVYEFNVSTDSGNIYGLERLTDSKLSDDNKVPKIQKIFSVTDEIQGFARTTDGKLVLSQSYGLKNSHLYYHDWSKIVSDDNKQTTTIGGKDYLNWYNYASDSAAGENFAYEGVKSNSGAQYTVSDLKVYFIDSKNTSKPNKTLIRDYSIPSMSEGLCVIKENGTERVCVLFESGAKKYKTFVRQITDEIYSFVPRQKTRR